MRILTLFSFFVICNLNTFSQTITCERLTSLKRDVYGFKPSQLPDSLQKIKSKDLDAFWDIAQNNRADAAKCLKGLIKGETNDGFFCFDAATLLLQLDTTGVYLPTVAEGLNKADLEDIQLLSYLQICSFLGHKGIDIDDLTIKLLSLPNAKIYRPLNFIILNAIEASIFLINNMPTSRAESVLFTAIQTGNATAKHNATVVLNLLSTDKGDSLINTLQQKKQLEESTIEYIEQDRRNFIIKSNGLISRLKILESLEDMPYNIEKGFYGFARNEKLISSACKQLTEHDVDKIRLARQKSTQEISQEALNEYYALTKILMTVRNKK